MAGFTVLQLIQAACDEAKVPRPSLVASPTDTYDRLLVGLFYATCRELRAHRCWEQLKKEHIFQLEPYRQHYQLPNDFFAMVPMTAWDRSHSWELPGPASDGEFICRSLGVTRGIRRVFRMFGPDLNRNSGEGQFMIDPVPGPGDAGQICSYEYVSKNFLLPPDWAALTNYSSVTPDYRHVGGRIYKCVTTGSSGVTPPTMIYGRGRSGSAYLTALTVGAWASSTYYNAFEYATNGGNLYRVTLGGQSAGAGGPSGTTEDTDITDNEVTWEYISTAAWAGVTALSFDDHVTQSGRYYRCTGAGVTGKVAPTWTTTQITDSTAVWEDYRPGETHSGVWWEQIVTSSEQCLFDEALVIAGLKWRYKREKGFDFESDQAEYERLKSSHGSRFSTGQRLRMGDSRPRTRPLIPEGSWNI